MARRRAAVLVLIGIPTLLAGAALGAIVRVQLAIAQIELRGEPTTLDDVVLVGPPGSDATPIYRRACGAWERIPCDPFSDLCRSFRGPEGDSRSRRLLESCRDSLDVAVEAAQLGRCRAVPDWESFRTVMLERCRASGVESGRVRRYSAMAPALGRFDFVGWALAIRSVVRGRQLELDAAMSDLEAAARWAIVADGAPSPGAHEGRLWVSESVVRAARTLLRESLCPPGGEDRIARILHGIDDPSAIRRALIAERAAFLDAVLLLTPRQLEYEDEWVRHRYVHGLGIEWNAELASCLDVLERMIDLAGGPVDEIRSLVDGLPPDAVLSRRILPPLVELLESEHAFRTELEEARGSIARTRAPGGS